MSTPGKIVIVGGVAGGANAAARARRTNEAAEIVMFERGPYVSFANCGLPYFIGGSIQKRGSLLLQTPEAFWERFQIKVRVRHEVTRIDRSRKCVEVRNLEDGSTFTEDYDRLILSPGASAIVPPLPGLPADNVFAVKTVPDADSIRTWIAQQQPRRAVVVGAGFIGLETAEALAGLGLNVTVVEMAPQVLPALDADVAEYVAQHIAQRGLTLILGDGIRSLAGGRVASEVVLQSGRVVPADLVILSIGVRPELQLAVDAGLALGPTGALAVNERQQTSDPDIYAAGDATEVIQKVTGRPARMALAGPANKQGRVAGTNAAGGTMRFDGALGTSIVECLGVTAARTGLSEREAAKEGLSFDVTWTHPQDHAGYYPGATTLHLKLLSERKSGRLLGAQIVGETGVDKRIDVLATALYARLTVEDLENLDLAYAPQFSSAKDPVVMAGFVAGNVLRGDEKVVTWREVGAQQRSDPELQVVDVRTSGERDDGFWPGSVHVPLDELRARLGELDPRKDTIVYCRAGSRAHVAARILKQHGFERVRNITGGMLSCPAEALEGVRRRMSPVV